MKTAVTTLFARYESCVRQSLAGEIDMDEVATLYASDFTAASAAGVKSGKNDDQLKRVMAQGFSQYRAIGTRSMRIRHLRLSAIDDGHCIAHVAWTATFARQDLPETAIDFDVRYLVQIRNREAKVFGWVSGDEQALLKRHGVV